MCIRDSLKRLKARGIAPGVRLRTRRRTPDDDYAVSLGNSSRILHLSAAAASAIRLCSVHP